MRHVVWLIGLIISAQSVYSQTKRTFSKYDYLHGKLNPMRSCIDVKQYEITVKVDPARKFISGHNDIIFYTVTDFSRLQIDLFSEMKIDSVVYGNLNLPYLRDSNTVFVNFGFKIKKQQFRKLKIYFSGHPRVAKRAPWDGGFVWQKDSSGYDWVGMACEGIGASMWLPCKDHWSDEPDSMKMHLIVPTGLTGVSNGQLVSQYDLGNGYTQFNWKVNNPINLYGISINIGKYAHLHEQYYPRLSNEKSSPLALNYYVLEYNKNKAQKHFQQVQTMLACFERYFGLYPFWEDGYKLVETPYWGMEHQSAVAYGNDYRDNRYSFDFIIIHESAHEWFANSITAKDPAEMWIHESFTTYAEALYVECTLGKDAYLQYLKDQKQLIENTEPMVGPRDVFYHSRKDNDIYYKGSWMIHTMRNVMNNDSAFFATLKHFYHTYQKKIIETNDVIQFFNQHTTVDWTAFFAQYLYQKKLPELEVRIQKNADGNLIARYRWINTVKGFEMPVQVTANKGLMEVVVPSKSWQLLDLNFFDEKDFHVSTDTHLFTLKRTVN